MAPPSVLECIHNAHPVAQSNTLHFKEMKYLLEKLHETEAADLQATKTTSAELLALNVKINQRGNGTKASLLDTNVQHDKRETYFSLMDDVSHKENKPRHYSSLNETPALVQALKTIHAATHSSGLDEDAKCQLFDEQFLASVIIPHISSI